MNTRILKLAVAVSAIAFAGFAYASNAKVSEHITVIKPYNQKAFVNQVKKLYATEAGSHSQDIATRLATDSAFFLGQPYHLGSLGEGVEGKFDKSPLFRSNAFDCQTYTSTVLALAESDNYEQFSKTILKVRYSNDQPSYLTRNHFVSVDWNPHNQQNGFIQDITKTLYPKHYKIAQTTINKPAWFEHLNANNIKEFHKLNPQKTQELLTQLHALGQQTKSVPSNIAYMPLKALFTPQGKPKMALLQRIPNGSVIEFVRPNWDLKKLIGTNLNVSHLGYVFHINGQVIFREASSLDHKVVDVPLATYLHHYLNSKTLKGINIEKVIKPEAS